MKFTPNGPGYLTAQSRTSPDQTTGYVILDSKVTSGVAQAEGEPGAPQRRDTISLGRPWRPYARVVYINNELPADVIPEGWNAWGSRDESAAGVLRRVCTTPGLARTRRRELRGRISSPRNRLRRLCRGSSSQARITGIRLRRRHSCPEVANRLDICTGKLYIHAEDVSMPTETTYTALRENLASYLDRVIDDREVVVVKRRGARDVAIIAADELAGLEETAYLCVRLRTPSDC